LRVIIREDDGFDSICHKVFHRKAGFSDGIGRHFSALAILAGRLKAIFTGAHSP
jgi:hypothetical protein